MRNRLTRLETISGVRACPECGRSGDAHTRPELRYFTAAELRLVQKILETANQRARCCDCLPPERPCPRHAEVTCE